MFVAVIGDLLKIVFASKRDCIELLASEGDFGTSTGDSFCSVNSIEDFTVAEDILVVGQTRQNLQ